MKFRTLLSIFFSLALVSGCSMFGKGDKSDGLSESDLNAQREGRFGEGSIPSAEGEGMFKDIRFDYDSTRISDGARQNIEFNAEVLKSKPDLRIQLEGHCDERGTAEYNMALGAQRAKAVYEVLSSLGIPSSRLDAISYGEEVPLVQGSSEEAWAQNRRVHFSPFN